MEIRRLRYFVRIVELGSLSKASRILNVAQPALSQQVTKLEQSVGKPLLVRSSRGVTPNAAGRALYHHARLILRQLDQAMTIARTSDGEVTGIVSIGLPATTVAAIGLELVRRVRDRYPGISINVVEAMSGHLEYLVRQNQLDLAVLFSRDVPAEFSVEPLMIEELFLIFAEDSRFLRGRTAVTMAEAATVPLILPTSQHGLRRRIAAEFERRSLVANTVVEIDSLSLVMNCVNDDMGGTIKPMGAIMQEGRRGRRYRCLRFEDAQIRRGNYLYALPADALSSAGSIVAGVLCETVDDLLRNTEWEGFQAYPADNGAVAAASAAAAAASVTRPLPASSRL